MAKNVFDALPEIPPSVAYRLVGARARAVSLAGAELCTEGVGAICQEHALMAEVGVDAALTVLYNDGEISQAEKGAVPASKQQ